jgi:serine/threonine protein kinase
MHTNSPPEFPTHLSDKCRHFLYCCMKMDPKERLNVFKLLRHPFILGDSPQNFEISTYEYSRKVDDSGYTNNNSTINQNQKLIRPRKKKGDTSSNSSSENYNSEIKIEIAEDKFYDLKKEENEKIIDKEEVSEKGKESTRTEISKVNIRRKNKNHN